MLTRIAESLSPGDDSSVAPLARPALVACTSSRFRKCMPVASRALVLCCLGTWLRMNHQPALLLVALLEKVFVESGVKFFVEIIDALDSGSKGKLCKARDMPAMEEGTECEEPTTPLDFNLCRGKIIITDADVTPQPLPADQCYYSHLLAIHQSSRALPTNKLKAGTHNKERRTFVLLCNMQRKKKTCRKKSPSAALPRAAAPRRPPPPQRGRCGGPHPPKRYLSFVHGRALLAPHASPRQACQAPPPLRLILLGSPPLPSFGDWGQGEQRVAAGQDPRVRACGDCHEKRGGAGWRHAHGAWTGPGRMEGPYAENHPWTWQG